MQRRQYEGLSLDDAINRLLAIKPVETEAEEIVEKCAAARIAIGSVLCKELAESFGEESVPRGVILDGHWSATELIYWTMSVYHPEVWSALASDPRFATIAFLPLDEAFHGAETQFGALVWASHADPATLTESDIENLRGFYLQVSLCFSRLTWQLAAVFEVLEKYWDDHNVARKGYGPDDMHFAARFYDVLRSSSGEESCGKDYSDEGIEYRINDARTEFAQIAIQSLLLRGVPIRSWDHFLESLFTRWLSEKQRLYASVQIAVIGELKGEGENLPESVTSRYSESELAVAQAAIRHELLGGVHDE